MGANASVRRSHQGRTRFADQLFRGDGCGAFELVEDVPVGVERHRRRVSGLAGDVDDGSPFCDKERHERVAEVVGPDCSEPRRLRRRLEDAVAPVAPVGVEPRLAVGSREDELPVVRPPELYPQDLEVAA